MGFVRLGFGGGGAHATEGKQPVGKYPGLGLGLSRRVHSDNEEESGGLWGPMAVDEVEIVLSTELLARREIEAMILSCMSSLNEDLTPNSHLLQARRVLGFCEHRE